MFVFYNWIHPVQKIITRMFRLSNTDLFFGYLIIQKSAILSFMPCLIPLSGAPSSLQSSHQGWHGGIATPDLKQE